MAVMLLTTAQQRAVEALVAARRLERVPVDEQRCAAFLSQAETALSDLPNVTHAQNTYNLAYDAAHDVGEAMLAAYGCRTRHGPGQHDALGRFLAAIFDSPPENAASQHYDRMRRDRNRQRYNAQPITTAAATAAADAATTLFRAGRSRVQTVV
ncbi:hypothetical protein [Geodermatophilus chilensis]|uniref:hypothetical protein n=1 Tax=Geodermatophilus chilensis TaxID=2035835 RepID=UPI001E2A77DD|nr:hypothetical protein [Geodermatophilus chilensis]